MVAAVCWLACLDTRLSIRCFLTTIILPHRGAQLDPNKDVVLQAYRKQPQQQKQKKQQQHQQGEKQGKVLPPVPAGGIFLSFLFASLCTVCMHERANQNPPKSPKSLWALQDTEKLQETEKSCRCTSLGALQETEKIVIVRPWEHFRIQNITGKRENLSMYPLGDFAGNGKN